MINKHENLWHKRQEKGSIFWIRLSFLLVKFCPRFVLKIISFVVALVFWGLCGDERDNINAFYTHLENKFGKDSKVNRASLLRTHWNRSFWNFYEFALSINDKIGIYLGKIKPKNLHIRDESAIKRLFCDYSLDSKGRVILMSHFGNIEIAKALSLEYPFKIAILVYQKNAANFNMILNTLISDKIKVFSVDNLGVEQMLEISHFMRDGGHLCVMGDRVSLGGTRAMEVGFLGEGAMFPQGGALLSAILKCELWALWCVRNGDTYEIWADLINSNPSRATLDCDTKSYVLLLERNVSMHPQMWFNFFDFWRK